MGHKIEDLRLDVNTLKICNVLKYMKKWSVSASILFQKLTEGSHKACKALLKRKAVPGAMQTTDSSTAAKSLCSRLEP